MHLLAYLLFWGLEEYWNACHETKYRNMRSVKTRFSQGLKSWLVFHLFLFLFKYEQQYTYLKAIQVIFLYDVSLLRVIQGHKKQ